MGCVASRIDKEERVRVCKERKRLMKQLVGFRGEFADAQLAYLRALKNTGVTLGQFTESESLELESTSYVLAAPPSPPLSLPPSPPPPPPFSPDLRKSIDSQKEVAQEESMTIEEDDCSTPPPPLIPSSWDPFEPSWPQHEEKDEMVEPLDEEENWDETKTEFEEDLGEEDVGTLAARLILKKQQQQHPLELIDDNSSMVSWQTKDTVDMARVLGRSKKSLEGIIKELDDYFLKASAAGKEIAVLMDVSTSNATLLQNFKENKRKRSNSAKVFSALSWSWSSKSMQLSKDSAEVCTPSEPCKPGAHRITLNKLYVAEQRLHNDVKEEEMTKLELEKKSMLLLKREEENYDWAKTDKTRETVESLETDIRRLQHSISTTRSSILELIDVELYPQLVTMASGLKNVWRTMYECHQVQNHISLQLNHLTDGQGTNFTTDNRRQATAQLRDEVSSWYMSFCKLVKSQEEYVRTLSKWIQLTNCLVDDGRQSSCSSAVRRLCDEWLFLFDRLPDKIASEAIKTLLSAIRQIMQQQEEEYSLHKRSDKLEKRLQKELISLAEMEKMIDRIVADGDSNLSPKHPLSLKHAKTEALKKQADIEKAKYLKAVQVTRAMTLNNLKMTLPALFQALMAFSGASAQGFEAVLSRGKPEADCVASENSTG